jgi:hypothetical protein
MVTKAKIVLLSFFIFITVFITAVSIVSADSDFFISVNPNSASINPGEHFQTIVDVILIDTTKPVNLSCLNLPSEATCTFDPESLSTNASSILTISTSSNIQPGTYKIMIIGNDGERIKSDYFYLTINEIKEPFDFDIDAYPSSIAMFQDETVSSLITLELLSGKSQPVSLTVTSPEIDSSISPNTCNPDCNAILTISTNSSTEPGTYIVNIIANSSEITKTFSIPILVLESVPFQTTTVQPTQLKPKQNISYPIAVSPEEKKKTFVPEEIPPTPTIEIERKVEIPFPGIIVVLALLIFVFLISRKKRIVFYKIFYRPRRDKPEEP